MTETPCIDKLKLTYGAVFLAHTVNTPMMDLNHQNLTLFVLDPATLNGSGYNVLPMILKT